jgi:hypothetical protein
MPTHYRAPFAEASSLRIPPQVHRLGARQFFVQAIPTDAPCGATLHVFPFTRITTHHDGTVDIVFPTICSGIITLVPMPEGLPVPTPADLPSSSPERVDSPA